MGNGVICGTRGLAGTVIPAEAGIHTASHWKCAADALDSRFRGNDLYFERDPIPNDTTTPGWIGLTAIISGVYSKTHEGIKSGNVG